MLCATLAVAELRALACANPQDEMAMSQAGTAGHRAYLGNTTGVAETGSLPMTASKP